MNHNKLHFTFPPLAKWVQTTVSAGILAVAAGTAGTALAGDEQDAALERAYKLLEKHPVIDGHNDFPYVIRESKTNPRDVPAHDLTKTLDGDTDLGRLRKGRVGAQFWAMYVPGDKKGKAAGFTRMQLEQIDITRRMIEQHPEHLMFATTAADIEQAQKEGRIASLLGIEGGHAIENSLGALRMYYRLGVRYMTLTHNPNIDWADSAGNDIHGGLTPFGYEVIREMNRLGMLVDLSHVSINTMNDALDVAEAPVIFSHSNANAVTPHVRNVPDDVLKRLPKNGGIVMASFVSPFTVNAEEYAVWKEGFQKANGNVQWQDDNYFELLDAYAEKVPAPKATVADVADHVEYIRKVAGIDHVAIGSDYFGFPIFMAEGMEDASSYPLLFAELIRRGWSDDDLIKLSRTNLLRVLKQTEKVAAKLQKERKASFLTIEQLDHGQEKPNMY